MDKLSCCCDWRKLLHTLHIHNRPSDSACNRHRAARIVTLLVPVLFAFLRQRVSFLPSFRRIAFGLSLLPFQRSAQLIVVRVSHTYPSALASSCTSHPSGVAYRTADESLSLRHPVSYRLWFSAYGASDLPLPFLPTHYPRLTRQPAPVQFGPFMHFPCRLT